MDRIFSDLRNYQNPGIERYLEALRKCSRFTFDEHCSVSSSHGLMYVVGIWLDKIEKQRKEVQKWFKKLEFFSTNLKPQSVLDAENCERIEFLVKSAFDCHLNKEEEDKTVSRFVKSNSLKTRYQ